MPKYGGLGKRKGASTVEFEIPSQRQIVSKLKVGALCMSTLEVSNKCVDIGDTMCDREVDVNSVIQKLRCNTATLGNCMYAYIIVIHL